VLRDTAAHLLLVIAAAARRVPGAQVVPTDLRRVATVALAEPQDFATFPFVELAQNDQSSERFAFQVYRSGHLSSPGLMEN
jgi:hypothetical protein